MDSLCKINRTKKGVLPRAIFAYYFLRNDVHFNFAFKLLFFFDQLWVEIVCDQIDYVILVKD